MARIRFLVLGLFSLLLVATEVPGGPPSADDHCDRDLVQPREDAWGYRLRDDRCEGLYVQEVAGRTLRVVSLTESFEEYDPASSQRILLEWKAPAGATRSRGAGPGPKNRPSRGRSREALTTISRRSGDRPSWTRRRRSAADLTWRGGSSARRVPAPIRIASLPARRRSIRARSRSLPMRTAAALWASAAEPSRRRCP